MGLQKRLNLKRNGGKNIFAIRTFLNKASASVGLARNRIKPLDVLLIVIFLLGTFSRVWEFPNLPAGLHQDEVSIALEAYDLYHYGVDRNGFSFPLQFISFGSGTNEQVFTYVMIPFLAVGGLTPVSVRLPMLLSGILILPMAYFVARKTMGKKYAVLAVFFIAISPWHIIQSRWAHVSNFLPFMFLAGYVCLIKSKENNKWFIPAMILLALCIYVYGPAYASVPIFLAFSIPVLYKTGRVSKTNLISGLVILAVMLVPFGIVLIFNFLKLDTLHFGIFTLPRLSSQPRYASMITYPDGGIVTILFQNLLFILWSLLIQVDGVWNTVVPYGYFYTLTFPLAILGGIYLLKKRSKKPEQLLLVVWLAAAFVVGIMVHANFNHTNLIFTPLIFCVVLSLKWLRKHFKFLRTVIIFVLFMSFLLFTKDFHFGPYRQLSGKAFFADGLLPAIGFASEFKDNPICISEVNKMPYKMPYVYVLFSQKIPPSEYLNDIEYLDPTAPFRKVIRLGRYSFGLENCQNTPTTIYILSGGEKPFSENIAYHIREFDSYSVYLP